MASAPPVERASCSARPGPTRCLCPTNSVERARTHPGGERLLAHAASLLAVPDDVRRADRAAHAHLALARASTAVRRRRRASASMCSSAPGRRAPVARRRPRPRSTGMRRPACARRPRPCGSRSTLRSFLRPTAVFTSTWRLVRADPGDRGRAATRPGSASRSRRSSAGRSSARSALGELGTFMLVLLRLARSPRSRARRASPGRRAPARPSSDRRPTAPSGTP